MMYPRLFISLLIVSLASIIFAASTYVKDILGIGESTEVASQTIPLDKDGKQGNTNLSPKDEPSPPKGDSHEQPPKKGPSDNQDGKDLKDNLSPKDEPSPSKGDSHEQPPKKGPSDNQ
ncbi:hypothetical protein NJ959_10290, partial [Symplocastrum sp. BBK-W-15]